MKTIYLNRHAKSSWKQPYNSDFERGLNSRGKINAEFMAKRFAQEVDDVKLISSPARRAKHTAQYFAEALQIPPVDVMEREIIYGATTGDMLALIRGFDNSWESVILFGHNPTFSDLAALLDHSFNDHLVTCARVKLNFELEAWEHVSPDSGTVMYHDYPRKYPEMENL